MSIVAIVPVAQLAAANAALDLAGIGPLTTQTHYIGSNGSLHFGGKGRRYAVLATASALTAPQLATLIAWAEEGRA